MDKSTMLLNLDNIPAEMKALRRWVVWRIEDDDPSKKVPYDPRSGGSSGNSSPKTWRTFDEAKKAYLEGNYDGIGFMLGESPYAIIDLDGSIDPETREVKPWAQAIVDRFASFTEISQSGTGLHIVVHGVLPGTGKKRGNKETGGIEIYARKHYFAMTGNLLEGSPTVIEDRPDEVLTFVEEIFGDPPDSVPESFESLNLVLDPKAEPPLIKLEALRKRRGFIKTYEHRRTDLPSLSEYDMSLANYAAGDDWSNQEIADLIISFRRKHGEEANLKKVLRPDYIAGLIAKVKHADALGLLPFEVKQLLQLGTEDAEYVLELVGGTTINMGETSAFRSPNMAGNKLFDAGFALSKVAIKRWPEITMALRSLVKVESTVTVAESTELWLREFLSNTAIKLLMIDPDDPEEPDTLNDAMARGSRRGWDAVVRDKQGRIYLTLHGQYLMNSARQALGQHLSQKAMAGRLRKIGFVPSVVASVKEGGDRRQIRMWASPVGFLSPVEGTAPKIVQVDEKEEEEEGLDSILSPKARADRLLRRVEGRM